MRRRRTSPVVNVPRIIDPQTVIAQTTVRDFEQMHGLPITNVHETFFTLNVGLISLIRSHPGVSDRTIKEVIAQTLHIESYIA